MSIQTEISRLQTLRNNIRTKLISLGLLSNADATLADCQTALDGVDLYTGGNTITSNGTVACAGKYMAENLTVEVNQGPSEYKATISGTNFFATVSIGGVKYDQATLFEAGLSVEIEILGRWDRSRVYLDGAIVASENGKTLSYSFVPTSDIGISFVSDGTASIYCYITTGGGYSVNNITTDGSYDNATYHGDYWAAIDGSGNLLLVVEGGTSSTYENIKFTAASVPSGVSLENMTKYTSSNATGGLYAALFTGISSNVDIALDFNARNGANDYVTCEVTITEA